MIDSRDLRETRLYRQVKAFYEHITADGRDEVTDAADVTLSPDGKFAALTGTIHRDVLAPPTTRVCLVRIESGELTRIPSSRGNDRLPLWSTDGRWLSFISDRAEAGNFQLHLCNGDGSGAIRAAPPVEGIIERTQWSPDGRQILLVVAGFGADLAGCQGGATTLDKHQELPTWMPAIETADASNRWRRIYVFDTASFKMTFVETPGFNCWEAAWLGNDRFVAVTSRSHAEGTWYRSQLTCFSLVDGTAKLLYTPVDQIGVPAASSDGRIIALIEAVCSDRMIVAGKLLLVDAATGSVTHPSTQSVDVTHLAWRDERHLVFIGHRSLETVVGELDIESGTLIEHWASTERTCGNWYPSMWPARGGGCMAICEAYDVAPELVRLHDGRYEVIASFDARDASASPPATIEPVSWRARDGLELQGWLLEPAGPGPFPLVMDIHGGPIWACRNRWQGRLRGAKVLTDHGFAVFFPNPRGSGGRGADFARLVVGDMGGEDTHDYLTGIDALIERGIADPTHLGVTGISYGGYMTAWLITQDTRFAAAAPISCISNWYSQHRTSQIPYFDELFLNSSANIPGGPFFERSPAMFAHAVRTPTLHITGGLDRNTPPTQALEFHRSLVENGVKSVLVTYPNAGHGVRSFPEVIDATTRYVGWLLEHLA